MEMFQILATNCEYSSLGAYAFLTASALNVEQLFRITLTCKLCVQSRSLSSKCLGTCQSGSGETATDASIDSPTDSAYLYVIWSSGCKYLFATSPILFLDLCMSFLLQLPATNLIFF